MDAERKRKLRAVMEADADGLTLDEQREVFDALDAAEARAERAEKESDALQGDIDSIQERWHDAVAAIHVALGGDGEWKAHAGAQPPIEESGHLHLASKAMAENLVAERDRLRGEVEAWRRGCALVGNLCEHGGRALNRPECREVGDA